MKVGAPEENLEEVMNFIRLDGPVDAPFVFLTIEDGGNFGNKEEFISFFNNKENETPKRPEGPITKKQDGNPGIIISKLMSIIVDGKNPRYDNWDKKSEWREYKIYKGNECNLKFYPIARKKKEAWPEDYKELLGTKEKYLKLCNEVRAGKIKERYGSLLKYTDNKVIIILGAAKEWGEVMAKINGDVPIENIDGKFVFFENKNGKLVFSYFNMWRWGIFDNDIINFTRKLEEQLRAHERWDAIVKQLKLKETND